VEDAIQYYSSDSLPAEAPCTVHTWIRDCVVAAWLISERPELHS